MYTFLFLSSHPVLKNMERAWLMLARIIEILIPGPSLIMIALQDRSSI